MHDMETLDYLRLEREHQRERADGFSATITINILTNFTDDMVRRLLVGMCLSEDIYPDTWVAPYKQYHFLLQAKESPLYKRDADITFVLFDLNPYLESEFTSREHFQNILDNLSILCGEHKGIVVAASFLQPTAARYGLKKQQGRLWELVSQYNAALAELCERTENMYFLDTNALAQGLDERKIRDMRNLYAFDMPFAQEFCVALSAQWLSYIKARLGQVKKCLVLDLDNVLWGGVVGEVGPLGIAIGPDYPGNAFRALQRAAIDLYERGVILAINSKNNIADVLEVFEKNPHMLLKLDHFAAVRINWEDKTDNLRSLADELNIGLDSMVFLDDDAVNREMVRTVLPQVLVPDFSLAPEEYAITLLSLSVFDSLSVTAEDKERNRMYAQERQRKEALSSATTMEEYLRKLDIVVRIVRNSEEVIARASQLTLKTNQFNLTTRRYTEQDIRSLMREGSVIYTADVRDSYGNYGITNVAIVQFVGDTAIVDSFLMSCRVFGRGAEFALMEQIVADAKERDIHKIIAHFIPTTKNDPAKDFLPALGYAEVGTEGDVRVFALDALAYRGFGASFPRDAITVTVSDTHQ